MQSQYQVKGLLEGLLWLKEASSTKSSELKHYKGICYNLNKYCSEYCLAKEYDFVEEASWGWLGHSGRRAYPVRDNLHLKYWEGENLEQRLSLLDHLISIVGGMTNEECIRRYSLYK